MPARTVVQSRLITGASSRVYLAALRRCQSLTSLIRFRPAERGNGIEASPNGPPNPTGHMRNLEADFHTPGRNESHNLDTRRLRDHHQPVPRDAAGTDGRPELKPEMATDPVTRFASQTPCTACFLRLTFDPAPCRRRDRNPMFRGGPAIDREKADTRPAISAKSARRSKQELVDGTHSPTPATVDAGRQLGHCGESGIRLCGARIMNGMTAAFRSAGEPGGRLGRAGSSVKCRFGAADAVSE
jgi:hypothetical protein